MRVSSDVVRKARWWVMSCGATLGCEADDVERDCGADAEPDVEAVVEGFGDALEAEELPVEGSAAVHVGDVEGDVVEGHVVETAFKRA